MQVPLTYIDLIEYLEAEDNSQIRHEYLNGQLFGMTGGSREHNLITGNIHNRLKNHLRGSGCQVFASDMKVRIETDNVLVESRAGIIPRPSLLDPDVKLSPHLAPDSVRLCLLLMCK